jgi:hypothetical protein
MPRKQAVTFLVLDMKPLWPCKIARNIFKLFFLIRETGLKLWRLYSIERHIAWSYESQRFVKEVVQPYFEGIF